MPDKKLIPLSILPLHLELTLNPYALYCATTSKVALENAQFNRDYVIKDITICGHMLTFE